jgi:hypothetical protein
MKHVASRLVRYANENKIIHLDAITDVALRMFACDRRINHKIRSALHEIDPQLELLIPYQVDDHEKQLKRYIQDKMGLVVNLSQLQKKHNKHYVKLFDYGSPAEVIKRWGLDYTYDRNVPREKFVEHLQQYVENGIIRRLKVKDNKLYMAIVHQARKEGVTVKQYIESLGFAYDGN